MFYGEAMQRADIFVLLSVLSVPVSVPDDIRVPLFDGLGGFSRTVSTESPESQRYFDQGLSFMYAFNHDEAIRSFKRAAEIDSKCAMAFWGIAIANGPHINNPVSERAGQRGMDSVEQGKRGASHASPVERALIDALGSRYADPPPADRGPLDQAYADAMRRVWADFPRMPMSARSSRNPSPISGHGISGHRKGSHSPARKSLVKT